MSEYVQSYFDPSYRVVYRPDSEGRNMRAATARVAEYDAEFKASAERKAGRPLSQTEVLRGITPREDRLHQTQQDDSRWRPKMAPVSGTVYERIIAEVNGEKRLDTSPTREGLINRLRTGQRELDADADKQAAEREWLADPLRQKALAELDELAATFKHDTSRTASEHEAIRKARLQISTPGADVAEARRLLNVVFKHEAEREQVIRQAAESEIASAQARLANLKSSQRPPKVAPPIGSNTSERLHDLFNKMNAAGYSSDDLGTVTEARESKDQQRMEWVVEQFADVGTE